jgi:hypothetical protein
MDQFHKPGSAHVQKPVELAYIIPGSYERDMKYANLKIEAPLTMLAVKVSGTAPIPDREKSGGIDRLGIIG